MFPHFGKTIGIGRAFPQDRAMLNEMQRRFVESRRVGHLATADAGGAPYLVPVCFALAAGTIYVTIDEKPKRRDRPMKRVRNIRENPRAARLCGNTRPGICSRGGIGARTNAGPRSRARARLRRTTACSTRVGTRAGSGI